MKRKLVAFRTCLVLAIVAVTAVFAISYLELRPRMKTLSKEREAFKTSSEQNEARAMKAETSARELSERLAEARSLTEAAFRETKRATDDNARLLIDLEESRAMLHAAKQELARWNATGATPHQVASFAHERKNLTEQLSQLQAKHDRLVRDLANAKRVLDITPDNPDLPPMRGSVLVVDPKWNFVVLDLGETNGLVRNGVLMISREGKLIGKVKVRRVEPERSIADILPGWRISEVREGDQVMN